jgi:hypothetical protein
MVHAGCRRALCPPRARLVRCAVRAPCARLVRCSLCRLVRENRLILTNQHDSLTPTGSVYIHIYINMGTEASPPAFWSIQKFDWNSYFGSHSITILVDFYWEFNTKRVGGGGPHSITILIDFYEEFNTKRFGRKGLHSIAILIDLY